MLFFVSELFEKMRESLPFHREYVNQSQLYRKYATLSLTRFQVTDWNSGFKGPISKRLACSATVFQS